MKLQFQVQDGKTSLSLIADNLSITVPLDGATLDGTPRIDRLAEKLTKAADQAAAGKDYRYALNI